jgi:hypothetical protein
MACFSLQSGAIRPAADTNSECDSLLSPNAARNAGNPAVKSTRKERYARTRSGHWPRAAAYSEGC